MNGGLYPDLHRPTVGQQMLLDDETGAEVAAAITAELFESGIGVTWGQRVPMDPVEIREMWRSMDERGGTALMHDLLHYVADRRANETRWREALEGTDVPQTFVWGDLVDDLLWVMAEASGRLAGGGAEAGRADQALGSGGLVCGQACLARRLLDGVARCARGRSRCGPGQEQREDSRVAFRG